MPSVLESVEKPSVLKDAREMLALAGKVLEARRLLEEDQRRRKREKLVERAQPFVLPYLEQVARAIEAAAGDGLWCTRVLCAHENEIGRYCVEEVQSNAVLAGYQTAIHCDGSTTQQETVGMMVVGVETQYRYYLDVSWAGR